MICVIFMLHTTWGGELLLFLQGSSHMMENISGFENVTLVKGLISGLKVNRDFTV